jgi:hypothetical protein
MWPLTNSLARRGTSWARLDDLVDPTRTWLPFKSRPGDDEAFRLCGGGSGKWLIRRADVWGQVGHAGLQSRPRVPSRACRFSSFLVGEHLRVDDVGQPSFEGADGLHGCPAGGLLASK